MDVSSFHRSHLLLLRQNKLTILWQGDHPKGSRGSGHQLLWVESSRQGWSTPYSCWANPGCRRAMWRGWPGCSTPRHPLSTTAVSPLAQGTILMCPLQHCTVWKSLSTFCIWLMVFLSGSELWKVADVINQVYSISQGRNFDTIKLQRLSSPSAPSGRSSIEALPHLDQSFCTAAARWRFWLLYIHSFKKFLPCQTMYTWHIHNFVIKKGDSVVRHCIGLNQSSCPTFFDQWLHSW